MYKSSQCMLKKIKLKGCQQGDNFKSLLNLDQDKDYFVCRRWVDINFLIVKDVPGR